MSLVTGPERKQVTSISGFKTGSDAAYSQGSVSREERPENVFPNGMRSDILSRVDVTSDEEFVVGTSLSMTKKLENSMAKRNPSPSVHDGKNVKN